MSLQRGRMRTSAAAPSHFDTLPDALCLSTGVFFLTIATADAPAGSQRVLFVLASARPRGNSEHLARAAAAALPSQAVQEWIRLSDTPLAPFRDIRHETPSYSLPDGRERMLLDATLSATDLVIVAPLYWYSLPASAKLYLDYWAGWLRIAECDFRNRMKGKRLWAVTVISSDDDSTADALTETLQRSADYLDMDWRGVLLGHGSRPGEIALDAKAIAAAAHFFGAAAMQHPQADVDDPDLVECDVKG